MADCLDPSTSAWEQIHGIHHVPKAYVPPFMKEQDPEKIKEDMYDLQVELEAEEEEFQVHPRKAQTSKNKPPVDLDNQQQNLEDFDEMESGKRQIKDMRFIRFKVKTLRIEDETLLHKIIDRGFNLSGKIPLPDPYQQIISDQEVTLNNYEVLGFNEFAFNSLSLFNFRIDESTLGDYVQSELRFGILEHNVQGQLKMNKLIMSHDFKLETSIELIQTIETLKSVKVEGKKRAQEIKETERKHVGSLQIEMNLQSGDSEDEMRRNYQIKMQRAEEERAKQEQERIELQRKKMQFQMESTPVFGQIYIHIDRLGHIDNIGQRSKEQIQIAQENLGSTLNNRAGTTDEEENKQSAVDTDTLERGSSIKLPKRNFFVQFKAFPNLETLKTNTVWQEDDNACFNYRSQFPVLMCPDTLEKMEKFCFVLELWDQISPSVQEFLGIVKIPLAPIVYSMKTTDNEIYSLNFMADQFCMYPMTISDGFLPVYSPKQG